MKKIEGKTNKMVKVEEVNEPSYEAEAEAEVLSVETAPDRSSACCDCSIF